AAEGSAAGRNAAEWWLQDTIGGRVAPRVDRMAAGAILRGLEDGDPAVLDMLPRADLSGEWAGDLTGPQLYDAAIVNADDWTMTRPEWVAYWAEHDAFTDICDAYESAFDDAVSAEVGRAARAIL